MTQLLKKYNGFIQRPLEEGSKSIETMSKISNKGL